MSVPSPSIVPRPVMTVLGPIPYEQLGITDAHNHVWIEPIPGANENNPVLNQYDLILSELTQYHQKGGATLLDCQPGGCGRDGRKLHELSEASRVNIIACSGFHRRNTILLVFGYGKRALKRYVIPCTLN